MDRHERRERRRSRRLLRQMDRAAMGVRGRRRVRPAVVLVTVLALGIGWAVSPLGSGSVLRDLLGTRAYVEIDGRAVAVPRAEASQGRVLPAVPVSTDGTHAFLHTAEDGGPVGYDPCRPVRYVLRPDGAPAAGQDLVADAIAIISQASGLAFVQVGTTDEEAVKDRLLIQPDRYGEGWAPVLIAWSDESELGELAGQVAGVGGSAAVPGADGQGSWLAAGRLVLDAPDLVDLMSRAGGEDQARAIIVHELGHVLGLDHVDDPTELMHPQTSSRADLGPGDLQGLALVGAVACEE